MESIDEGRKFFPIEVFGKKVGFQDDTGSDCDLISPIHLGKLENAIGKTISLTHIPKIDDDFLSINDEKVYFRGYFTCKIVYKYKTIKTKMYVIENMKSPAILGRESCIRLGIVKYETHETRHVRSIKLPKIKDLSHYYLKQIDILHKKYPSVYDGLGCLRGFEAHLTLNKNAIPFFERAAPIPINMKDGAEKRVRDYEKTKLWERVNTNEPLRYCSRLMVIPKPNRGPEHCRLVGNYVQLNKFLSRTNYVPQIRIEEIKSRMRGAKHFLKADLNHGYHQIKLSQQSRQMLTLSTPWGLFRPTRLPMGIVNGQDIFDQEIQRVLSGCLRTVVIRDDLLIAAETEQELIDEYAKVLEALSEAGLTLEPEKTVYSTKIKFFGYVFDGDGIHSDPNKIEALVNAPAPTTHDGVTSFLCTSGWNQQFIFRFSERAIPLRQLALQKGKMIFKWDPEHQRAFEDLKDALCENTMCSHFDPLSESIIYCDAGKRQHVPNTSGCLSAVLVQTNDKGQQIPISFNSKTLSDCQTRYSQLELESLAIKWSLHRYSYYLIGSKKFTVFTDCQPLVSLWNRASDSVPPRIMNHILSCQHLNFELRHKPGKFQISDFATRHRATESDGKTNSDDGIDIEKIQDDLCVRVDESQDNRRLIMLIRQNNEPIFMNDIRENTQKCKELQFLRQRIERGDSKQNKKHEFIRPYLSFINELSIIDGIIFRGSGTIIIPSNLRQELVETIHSKLSHPGETSLFSLFSGKFWFPGIREKIRFILQTCPQCQIIKPDKRKEPYSIRKAPAQPMDEIVIDHKSSHCGKKLLCIIDAHSRFTYATFVKGTSWADNKQPLLDFFSRFGTPNTIRSDGGSPFSSFEFENFKKETGFHHQIGTANHPESQSEVENFNKNISRAYELSKLDKTTFPEEVTKAIRLYNSTPREYLAGRSPHEIMFGYPPNLGLIPNLPITPTPPKERWEETKNALDKSKIERANKHKDSLNVKELHLRIGDKVLVIHNLNDKFGPKKKYMPDVHQVSKIQESRITAVNLRTGKAINRHLNHFRLFLEREKLDNDNCAEPESSEENEANEPEPESSEENEANEPEICDSSDENIHVEPATCDSSDETLHAETATNSKENENSDSSDETLHAETATNSKENENEVNVIETENIETENDKYSKIDKPNKIRFDPEIAYRDLPVGSKLANKENNWTRDDVQRNRDELQKTADAIARRTRSKTEAPNLPFVLPSNPYRSKKLAGEIRDTHESWDDEKQKPP